MGEIIGEIKLVKAAKEYNCTASDFLINCSDLDEIREELNSDDLRELNALVSGGFKIQKDERYWRYFFKDGCDSYDCKESVIGRKLCLLYNLYEW